MTTELQIARELLEKLHIALCGAYPSEDELDHLIYYGLGENTNEIIPSKTNLNKQVRELIKWAEEKGRVQELIDKAIKANGTNPKIIALVSYLSKHSKPSHANHPANLVGTNVLFPEVWDCDLQITQKCYPYLFKPGGLYGFFIRSTVPEYQKNFCKRFMGFARSKGKITDTPKSYTITQKDSTDSIQQRANELLALTGNLQEQSILCSIRLESDDRQILANQVDSLWKVLSEKITDKVKNKYILLVFAKESFDLPEGIVDLGVPELEEGHIFEWVSRCTAAQNWDDHTFELWNRKFIASCKEGNELNIQTVFELLDWCRLKMNEKLTSDEFLFQLDQVWW